MLKFFKSLLLLGVIFFASTSIVNAADANLTIRNGDTIIFSGAVPLPTDIITVEDSEGAPHELDPSSVLSAVLSADTASENFEVSEITYFSSFGSLYLKCIDSFCDDWQYVVNGTSPASGIDQEILSGGETVWLYFGPTSQIELSADTITSSENVTVTTQKYDYENNAWTIRNGITVGLTQPNPNDPFSPTEILTQAIDANGQAVFSNAPEGSYDVGVKEDFYFPTKTLTVNAPATQSSGGGSSVSKSSGGNGGSVLGASTQKFDLPKAFKFLLAQQKENGSWGEDMYTDWAAIALASGNYQGNVLKLIKYLGESKLENPRLTDYERRAMALMVLGLNPYNTNSENYIAKIVASFDGAQFGDINEDNDDIFALMVLLNAGYAPEEEIVQKSLKFILGRQHDNGSWDESIDMTGAVLQVLTQMPDGDAKTLAITKAKEFLKEAQSDRLDGSWANSASSTAWALQGLLAIGEDEKDWMRGEDTPSDYFGTAQDTDGSIKNNLEDEELSRKNKIWETAYVISALSNKTWNETMQKYEKSEVKETEIPALDPKPKPLTAQKPAEIKTASSPTENKPDPEKSWFRKILNFFRWN